MEKKTQTQETQNATNAYGVDALAAKSQETGQGGDTDNTQVDSRNANESNEQATQTSQSQTTKTDSTGESGQTDGASNTDSGNVGNTSDNDSGSSGSTTSATNDAVNILTQSAKVGALDPTLVAQLLEQVKTSLNQDATTIQESLAKVKTLQEFVKERQNEVNQDPLDYDNYAIAYARYSAYVRGDSIKIDDIETAVKYQKEKGGLSTTLKTESKPSDDNTVTRNDSNLISIPWWMNEDVAEIKNVTSSMNLFER